MERQIPERNIVINGRCSFRKDLQHAHNDRQYRDFEQYSEDA